jgi:hypothetical protein
MKAFVVEIIWRIFSSAAFNWVGQIWGRLIGIQVCAMLPLGGKQDGL